MRNNNPPASFFLSDAFCYWCASQQNKVNQLSNNKNKQTFKRFYMIVDYAGGEFLYFFSIFSLSLSHFSCFVQINHNEIFIVKAGFCVCVCVCFVCLGEFYQWNTEQIRVGWNILDGDECNYVISRIRRYDTLLNHQHQVWRATKKGILLLWTFFDIDNTILCTTYIHIHCSNETQPSGQLNISSN